MCELTSSTSVAFSITVCVVVVRWNINTIYFAFIFVYKQLMEKSDSTKELQINYSPMSLGMMRLLNHFTASLDSMKTLGIYSYSVCCCAIRYVCGCCVQEIWCEFMCLDASKHIVCCQVCVCVCVLCFVIVLQLSVFNRVLWQRPGWIKGNICGHQHLPVSTDFLNIFLSCEWNWFSVYLYSPYLVVVWFPGI